MGNVTIRRLSDADFDTAVAELADILFACVHAGASVGFILPFSLDDAEAFWRDKVFPAVSGSGTALFVAEIEGRIVGTVQLGLALPPNQPHRADIAKLLVHPEYRRRGIADSLMRATEDEARRQDRWLLVLDTRSGDPSGRLYQKFGFQVAGEIPNYCRNPHSHVFEPTTYMYKDLSG